jgi:hypothetical protein
MGTLKSWNTVSKQDTEQNPSVNWNKYLEAAACSEVFTFYEVSTCVWFCLTLDFEKMLDFFP